MELGLHTSPPEPYLIHSAFEWGDKLTVLGRVLALAEGTITQKHES